MNTEYTDGRRNDLTWNHQDQTRTEDGLTDHEPKSSPFATLTIIRWVHFRVLQHSEPQTVEPTTNPHLLRTYGTWIQSMGCLDATQRLVSASILALYGMVLGHFCFGLPHEWICCGFASSHVSLTSLCISSPE
jgi:hypothetical protein